MRAVKCKNGTLSILNRDETALFNNIDFNGSVSISKLTERDHYIAEEMFKRNILRKVKQGDDIVYKTYEQRSKI